MRADVRLPDWEARLLRLIDERRDQPFAWGERDCCRLAADAVEAITGWQPLADLSASWRSARAAARVLKARGGLEAMVTELLGPVGDPRLAQRGDVVLLRVGRTPALGVIMGRELVAQGKNGLVWLPAAAALAAWPVGR